MRLEIDGAPQRSAVGETQADALERRERHEPGAHGVVREDAAAFGHDQVDAARVRLAPVDRRVMRELLPREMPCDGQLDLATATRLRIVAIKASDYIGTRPCS
ncbi:hypothetical protein [Burkholderia diffusa]|uniref:hypothetical protein n=1 Tax=Burkholderia diffusa TaxID=488732 RepID=UPI00075C0172|nr:hypothetical protein [Burkholderia diffusa]KVH43287.1 hypothetical protein WJ39_27320 [Burkholderia diffusa]